MLARVQDAGMKSGLRWATPIVITTLLLLLRASSADARPPWIPALVVGQFSNEFSYGNACRASASLLVCGKDLDYDLFQSDYALGDAARETDLSSDRKSAAEKAPLSGFALFAGKFMGRGDVASWGGLRIRFKVILE